MMALPNDPIARTGDRHFGQLEDGIIGGGKLAVGGEAHNTRVLQVPCDNGPEAVKFPVACGVCLHAVVCQ